MIRARLNKIKYLLAGMLGFLQLNVFGQADVAMASHWYNRASYNPASITRPGYVYIFTNVRRQWVNIDGAPTVYNLQASGFSENHNTAFGISAIRDDIGLTTAYNPSLQYAYLVELNEKLNLSLGLSAGVYSRKINASQYEADVINDPALDYTDEKYISPDANFGVELQAKHFIYGISSTHLFALWKPDDQFLISNHRYAYILYKTMDSELYNFMAGIQVMNRRNLTVFEATAIARIKRPTGLQKGPTELFDIGVTVRSVKQITMLTGIHISPNLRLGYTYDFGGSNSVSGSSTHEFVLEYRIPIHEIIETSYPWYN